MLSHPRTINIEDYDGIDGLFCYIIEHYGNEGISCLITRDLQQDLIQISCGDWDGNTIDVEDRKHPLALVYNRFISKHMKSLMQLMYAVCIPQAIFYFVPKNDGEFMLVDVRLSLNKFVGPGALSEIFGSVVETQKVLKIDRLDEPFLSSVKNGKGAYAGDLILKPSSFKLINVGQHSVPLYIEIIR